MNLSIPYFNFSIYIDGSVVLSIILFLIGLTIILIRPKFIGDTLRSFFKMKIVRVNLIVLGILSILILIFSKGNTDLDVYLSFIGEVTAVFLGLFLGFYYNMVYEQNKLLQELKKIYFTIIEELEYNLPLLNEIHKGKEGYEYGSYILKTTVWEIYKEQLGKTTMPNIEDLSNIYHKILIINENIKLETTRTYMSNTIIKTLHDYSGVTIKEINEWVDLIRVWYGGCLKCQGKLIEKNIHGYPIKKENNFETYFIRLYNCSKCDKWFKSNDPFRKVTEVNIEDINGTKTNNV